MTHYDKGFTSFVLNKYFNVDANLREGKRFIYT